MDGSEDESEELLRLMDQRFVRIIYHHFAQFKEKLHSPQMEEWADIKDFRLKFHEY